LQTPLFLTSLISFCFDNSEVILQKRPRAFSVPQDEQRLFYKAGERAKCSELPLIIKIASSSSFNVCRDNFDKSLIRIFGRADDALAKSKKQWDKVKNNRLQISFSEPDYLQFQPLFFVKFYLYYPLISGSNFVILVRRFSSIRLSFFVLYKK
jgi:hypothetical protein